MEDMYLTPRLITYRTTVSQPQGQANKHKQRRGEFQEHVIVMRRTRKQLSQSHITSQTQYSEP